MVDDQKPHRSFFARHKIFTAIGFIALVGLIIFIAWRWFLQSQATDYQTSIQPFYNIPSSLPSTQPGYLIRTEPMNISVPGGGTAYRILYVTQTPEGSPAVSSGMIFVPNTPVPAGGRKVVAWAHGTLGFGNQCTPSRQQTNPADNMSTWLSGMMAQGWVVTATDYTGIGTQGTPYYLVGQSEAHDVLNSVRAARNFTAASASNQFAVWGHSQGGHSSLWTGQLAKTYAPELNLVAVAAGAPAAELPSLLSEQYATTVAWAIGPDAAVSWPTVYPGLPVQGVLTSPGYKNYQTLANGCVLNEILGLQVRSLFHQQFFAVDPATNPQWYSAASAQIPNPTSFTQPLYITQSLSDTVVLPNTTALLVQQTCQKKTNLTVDWLGVVSHIQTAQTAGPMVVDWLQDRFNNKPLASTSCQQTLPIQPATPPQEP